MDIVELTDVQADAQAIIEAIDAVPAIVERFCKISGVAPTKLGYLAIGNPNILRFLKQKGVSQSDTIKRLLTWIVNWKPDRVSA